MTMLESSQLWVKVYVPETELARVHLGQTGGGASWMALADGRVFSGHVGQIASEAEFLPRNVQTQERPRARGVWGEGVRGQRAAGC